MSKYILNIYTKIFLFIVFLVAGVVKLTKNNKYFTIMSNCKFVHIVSKNALKKTDHINIENIHYKGGNDHINQVVSTNFTVSMESDSATSLHFNCTQWGEWEAFDNDGTCRTFVMKPLHNGQNTKGVLKYKHNKTCSKFSF